MKRKQTLKIWFLAAVILISAAFYVLSEEGRTLIHGDEAVLIGDADGTASGANGASGAEFGTAGIFGNGAGMLSGTAGAFGNGAGSNSGGGSDGGAGVATDIGSELAGGDGTDSGASGVLYTELGDASMDAVRRAVREAVREELMDICREGYLEEALRQAADEAAAEAERKKGMVDLNHADLKELMTLDGVGEKRAQDILSYREEHGGFTSPEDIMNVSGIKESLYGKIKDHIYTEAY